MSGMSPLLRSSNSRGSPQGRLRSTTCTSCVQFRSPVVGCLLQEKLARNAKSSPKSGVEKKGWITTSRIAPAPDPRGIAKLLVGTEGSCRARGPVACAHLHTGRGQVRPPTCSKGKIAWASRPPLALPIALPSLSRAAALPAPPPIAGMEAARRLGNDTGSSDCTNEGSWSRLGSSRSRSSRSRGSSPNGRVHVEGTGRGVESPRLVTGRLRGSVLGEQQRMLGATRLAFGAGCRLAECYVADWRWNGLERDHWRSALPAWSLWCREFCGPSGPSRRAGQSPGTRALRPRRR